MDGKIRRSVLLKNESYDDYLSALAKSGLDRRHFDWERLKKNGWTREQELQFRRDCQMCGFILPSYDRKKTTVGANPSELPRSCPLADSFKSKRNIREEADVQRTPVTA